MAWVAGRMARIITHERARAGRLSLADALLALARQRGLRASVTRADEGWSRRGGERSSAQVELSDDLPLVIEILGASERIDAALPDLIALAASHGTVTLTDARLWEPDTPA